METIQNSHNAIKEYFDNLDDAQLVNFYNEFAVENRYPTIYFNDNGILDELFSTPTEAFDGVSSDYSRSDEWAQFDGYGHLESSNDPNDFLDIDQLMEDARENPERYNIEFIDINDLDDEELFDYLKENDCSGDINFKDEYSDQWTRERLETIAFDNDLA